MPALMDSIRIGSLNLRNRIVMPPMATNLATVKGEVTDALIDHYVKRAKGLGLIVTEHSYVAFEGRLSRNQLGMHDDGLIRGLSRLTDEVHKKETPIMAQINHAGGRATAEVTGTQPVGPSPICVPDNTETPRELTISELHNIVEAFRQAARRAMKAGYDAVEIHGAHAFLLNEFLSPITNRRSDEFGGSIENRMRFPLMVVDAVRKEIGARFPLFFRLGAEDRMHGGLTLSESARAAKMLVEAGVDCLDISGGLCGSKPSDLKTQGYYFYLAEEIRKNVNVPVIGVGGVKEPKFADEAVRNGRVDLVAVGRAMIADPDWAVKAETALRSK